MVYPSPYNMFVENYSGKAILFNTNTNELLDVLPSQKNILKNLLLSRSSLLKTPQEQFLLSKGFLLSNEFSPICNSVKLLKEREKILQITILPTLSCNFRCPYCFEKHINQKMSRLVIEKIIEFVEKSVASFRVLSVHWYGGEPLLCLDLIQQISDKLQGLCVRHKKIFLASITTNGYLLTPSTYKTLRYYNINEYTITLDGPKSYHDQQRKLCDGSKTFDTIVENLKDIQKLESSSMVRFFIRTNFTKENYKKRRNWELFLEKEFLFDKRFRYVPRYTWNNKNSQVPSAELIPFIFNNFVSNINQIQLSLTHSSHQCNLALTHDFSLQQEAVAQLESLKNHSAICGAGLRKTLIVLPSGDVAKCQVSLASGSSYVGSIFDMASVDDYADNFSKRWWDRSDGIAQSDCLKCPVYPYCLSLGCAQKTYNSQLREHQWCQEFIQSIRQILMALSYYNNTPFR